MKALITSALILASLCACAQKKSIYSLPAKARYSIYTQRGVEFKAAGLFIGAAGIATLVTPTRGNIEFTPGKIIGSASFVGIGVLLNYASKYYFKRAKNIQFTGTSLTINLSLKSH